jgi:hypothetical protein
LFENDALIEELRANFKIAAFITKKENNQQNIFIVNVESLLKNINETLVI